MALNSFKCNYLIPLHFTGLTATDARDDNDDTFLAVLHVEKRTFCCMWKVIMPEGCTSHMTTSRINRSTNIHCSVVIKHHQHYLRPLKHSKKLIAKTQWHRLYSPYASQGHALVITCTSLLLLVLLSYNFLYALHLPMFIKQIYYCYYYYYYYCTCTFVSDETQRGCTPS